MSKDVISQQTKKQNTAFTLDPEVIAALEAAVEKTPANRSSFVNSLLREKLIRVRRPTQDEIRKYELPEDVLRVLESMPKFIPAYNIPAGIDGLEYAKDIFYNLFEEILEASAITIEDLNDETVKKLAHNTVELMIVSKALTPTRYGCFIPYELGAKAYIYAKIRRVEMIYPDNSDIAESEFKREYVDMTVESDICDWLIYIAAPSGTEYYLQTAIEKMVNQDALNWQYLSICAELLPTLSPESWRELVNLLAKENQ